MPHYSQFFFGQIFPEFNKILQADIYYSICHKKFENFLQSAKLVLVL